MNSVPAEAATARALPDPAGVVAAGDARDAHAPDLVGDHVGVADHEPGDDRERLRQPQPLQPAQQLGHGRGRGQDGRRGHPQGPLGQDVPGPQRPSTASDMPMTSTRSPWPTIGRKNAKARNGSSIRSRLARVAGGILATAARTASSSPYRPKAQNASLGVATTARTNSGVAAILHWGRARYSGLVPG